MNAIIIGMFMVLSFLTSSWYVYENMYKPAQFRLDELDSQHNMLKTALENKKSGKKMEEDKRKQESAKILKEEFTFFDLRRTADKAREVDQRVVRVMAGILRLMQHSHVLLADVKLMPTPPDPNSMPSPTPTPLPAGAGPAGTTVPPAPGAIAPTPTPAPTATVYSGPPKIVKRAEIKATATYGNIAYLMERIKELPPMIRIDSYEIKQPEPEEGKFKNCLELTLKLSFSFFVS